MKLSEMKWGKDRLIKDGMFDFLGYLNSKPNGKVLSYFATNRFEDQLINENLSCVVTTERLASSLLSNIDGIVISDRPEITFWRLHNQLSENQNEKTQIGSNCDISDKACIAEKNIVIGNNVVIEEFVSIKEGTVIGDNSIIRFGTIIGAVGFGFFKDNEKNVAKKHLGGVLIGNNVEIQNNSCVHRAFFSWDNTVIGDGTKIADYVHIGHACKIGRECMIAGKSLICGGNTIGDNVWIGPASVLKNEITIGRDVYLAMGSDIRRNVNDKMAVYAGKVMSVEKFNAIKNGFN